MISGNATIVKRSFANGASQISSMNLENKMHKLSKIKLVLGKKALKLKDQGVLTVSMKNLTLFHSSTH